MKSILVISTLLQALFLGATHGSMNPHAMFVLENTTNTPTSTSLDQPVWRLAGSFNNWNAADNGWAMARLPDGRYYLCHELESGTYDFKFVRDGSWDVEHLGATANDQHHLIQPGSNITISHTDDQLLTVVLDPEARTWNQDIPQTNQPVALMAISGIPRVGVPISIDLTRSLIPINTTIEEVEIQIESKSIYSSHDLIGRDPNIPNPLLAHFVTPGHTGPLTIRARIKTKNNIISDWTTISINVLNRVYYLDAIRQPNAVDLVPIDSGRTWVAVDTTSSQAVRSWKIRDTGSHQTAVALAHPAHPDGETFAIIYDRHLHRAVTVPGQYRLEEKDGTYSLVDETPIPEAGVSHDPRRPDHFISISETLGLADVVVWTRNASGVWDDQIRAISVLIDLSESDNGDVVVVPMSPDSNIDATRWSARVQNQIGDTKWVRYSIEYETTAGAVHTIGPFEARIDPWFSTPDWAQQAVWYQIFPERFRNGDPTNDPQGSWVFTLPWNAKWRTDHPGEYEAWRERVRAGGDDPDKWDLAKKSGNPADRFFNVIWDRRYGGDLQGIIEKLDYLDDLGVNAIYLNPVFEADSQHKYDTRDYRHIDGNFGSPHPVSEAPDLHPDEDLNDPETWTWTEADRTFLTLIEEVHARGMHIIVDGVFNHVGRSHPAFQDVMRNGQDSPYADWFMVHFDDDGRVVGWEAWDGKDGWLPRFAQDNDRSLVGPVRDHIFAITSRWMDPNGDGDPSDGIDGWRLDVPLEVGDPFWRDWCGLVRQMNPEAYVTAEIWTDWESRDRLRGDLFDAQMHYPFARAVLDWLALKPGMSTHEMVQRLEHAHANDAPQTQLIQQNLLESHDTDRVVSNLYNARPGREYDKGNRPQQGESYREEKPDKRSYELSKLAFVIQATYLGSPMIYYGQEIGMHGADDPSCRKPRPWPDLAEMDDPEDRPDVDLEKFYRHWLRLRRESPILQLGSVVHLVTGDPEVFAFERRLNDQSIVIVINKSNHQYDPNQLSGSTGRSLGIDDKSPVESLKPALYHLQTPIH